MQVESPSDILCAYSDQVIWLKRRLDKLKRSGSSETNPEYIRVLSELNWAETALSRLKGKTEAPVGHWVLVLRSKVAGLQDKVGKVTYVNTKNNFATVAFDGNTHSHNLGMSKLQVVDLPVPPTRIPAVGMRVSIANDPQEYVAVKWTTENVYVEPVSVAHLDEGDWNRYIKRVWVSRFDIDTINGATAI